MEFRALGPVEVASGARTAVVRGGHERDLLALLLLSPNVAVSIDHLIEELWPGEADRAGAASLLLHVATLRRALAEVSPANVEVLETRAPGYVLHAAPRDFDVARFEDHAAEGRHHLATGAAADALTSFRDALALWRGPAYADVSGPPSVAAEVARLTEARLAVLEDRFGAELLLGRHHEMLAELTESVVELPTREQLTRHLIVALHRAGRPADADAAYEGLRRALREATGAEPSAATSQFVERLRAGGEADVAPRGAAAPTPRTAPPAPAEVETEIEIGIEEESAPSFPPALAALADSPFVGREEELARLVVAWGETVAGQRRTVFVAGEPGIGKTRLSTELATRAYADGALVLFGRCDEEALVAYQPFVEALRGFVAATSRRRLAEVLGDSGGELTRLLPELRQLLPELDPPLSGDPEGDRYRLFGAVNDALVAMAARAPVLLVVDDLQWADKPTLLLIRHLLRAADETPLLVLGTYRETDVGRTHPLAETLADLRREQGYQRLALKGFAETDVRALLTAWLGKRAPSALARAVHVETEGNPFFVGEIVRHLADAGTSFDDEVDDVALEDLGIPEGIRDVVGRRVTRLSDDCQRLLSTASVVGREFDLDLLEQMVDLPADRCLEVVEEAIAAGMVREVGAGALRFEFSHTLIRETLYQELSAVRRTRVHRRAGEALEKLHGAATGPHLAELAHHFLLTARPGDTEKAIDYVLRVARRAAEIVAYEDAANHYEQVLHLLDLDDDGPSLARCQVLLALGETQRKAGDTATAKATLRTAADMADVLGAPDILGRAALVYAGRIEVTPMLTADPVATELLERALAVNGDARDALQVSLLARLAVALYWSGDEDRMRDLNEQASQLAREVDSPLATAAALSARRYVLWSPHNLAERRDDADTIIRLAHEAGAFERELEGRAWRMADLLESGDLEAFDREMAAHADLTEQLRQPAHQFYGLFVKGVRAMLAGDFDLGAKFAQQALDLGEQIGDANAQHFYAAHFATLLLFQGGLEALDPVLEEAIAMADLPAARASLAMFSVELDRLDEARTLYEGFVEARFENVPRDMLWLLTMAQLADVCAAVHDPEGAALLYPLLLPYDGRLVTGAIAEVPVWGTTAYYLGRLAGVLGDLEAAERYFEQALTLADEIGAPPFRARTLLAWAHLLQRAPVGDGDRVRAYLEEVVALADRHNMGAIGQRAASMLAG